MLTFLWVGGWFAWLIFGDSSRPTEAEGVNRAWLLAVGTAVSVWIDHRAWKMKEADRQREREAIMAASRESWARQEANRKK